MNLFQTYRQHILSALTTLGLPEGLNTDAVDCVPPREAAHGDLATNAAMVLAGQAKLKPRDIAEKLAEKLRALPDVREVEIAGPGFINLRLDPKAWQAVVPEILRQGKAFGNSQIGKGVKVNVEYVSANPTGPIHVGHARGSVYGDALSALLKKAGYAVTKEYYINDAGGQIDKLADSAVLRYREALGEQIEIPEGFYPGDYLIPVGKALAEKYGDRLKTAPREQWLKEVKAFVVGKMMDMIREDLAIMGIKQDVFTSEQEVRDSGKVDAAVKSLEDKGLIYVGVLEPPKGKPVPEDWEPRPQTLFRSTQFGDDADRAIKKSDGSWAYITPDIAYHYDKVQRGFDELIDVFGADHGGYVKRLKAAVSALSGGKTVLDIKLCQLVKLLRGGEPAKMSKRAGTFVTARDMVEEVGRDVFRFIMLIRKNDAPLDFDFDKVTEQSKDNPVFYVQYAHARAKSVLRRAPEEGVSESDKPDFSLLKDAAELSVIKEMASWPRLVESAALAHEPHRVAFYLHDLASAFHGLWHRGNDEISLRFIDKNAINVTQARLALARAVATVIASGLEVLGVEPVEEMR